MVDFEPKLSLSSSFLSSKSGANLTTTKTFFLKDSLPLLLCAFARGVVAKETEKKTKEEEKRANARARQIRFCFFLNFFFLRWLQSALWRAKVSSFRALAQFTPRRINVWSTPREREREREKTITRITINICSPHDTWYPFYSYYIYKSACCCVSQRVRRQHSRERERETN